MSNGNIDKFLTEAMGECYHKAVLSIDNYECDVYWACAYCSADPTNTDFSSWAGFGKLWEWASKQDWWVHFVDDYQTDKYGIGNIETYLVNIINPEKFATAVYEYLKSNGGINQ